MNQLVFLLLLGLSLQSVLGKRNLKNDKYPTSAPSKTDQPSIALFPSTAPSQRPMLSSLSDTPHPSNFDTFLMMSSTSPSFYPTININEAITLPEIGFTLEILQGTVDKTELESSIESFVNATMFSNSRILGDLVRVDLDVSVLDEVFNNRRLARRIQAIVNGVAYFETGEIPSAERLRNVLGTYFANWGDDDLKTYLSSESLKVGTISVELDGKLVSTSVPEEEAQVEGSQATFQSNDQESTAGSGSVDSGLIAGLVIGCCVLVIALGLLIWQRRRDQATDERTYAVASSSIDAGAIESSPMNNKAPKMQADDMSHEGYSIADESMYTTHTEEHFSASAATKSSDLYDAKRLDKVISTAHLFVATHEDPLDTTTR